jgi:hypothetical protein
MDKSDFYTRIYTRDDPSDPWYTFYHTRDWYDMPENIRESENIYWDEGQGESKNHLRSRRIYIYTKDLEFIYDCTPEASRSFLNDIRESLGLSTGIPVTTYDLQMYTGLDMDTIKDFILES